MVLGLSLREVRGCVKPGCTWLGMPLDRHHKAHQALWLGVWSFRKDEPLWRAFVLRYYEFRKEDICIVCRNHHAEIHSIYDRIIQLDMSRTRRRLSDYSWKQARVLMAKLEMACEVWLLTVTPGIDSVLYGQTKKLRRGLIKKQVKKRRPPRKGTDPRKKKRHRRR